MIGWKSLLIFIIAISFYLFRYKTCNRCNLIVLDVDIFRADSLDCERYPQLTPNLCEFQDEFVKFNNHYASSDLTKPNMASFLTSSYPTTHGIWNSFFFLDKKQPTIVDIAEKNGYHTIAAVEDNSQVISNIYNERINSSFHKLEILDLIKNKPTFLFIYYSDLHYPYLPEDPTTIISHPNKPENFPNNIKEFNKSAEKIIARKYPEIYEKPFMKEFIEKQDGSTEGVYLHLIGMCWGDNIEDKLVNDICWELTPETFEQYIDKNDSEDVIFIKYLYQEKIRELDQEIGQLINSLKSHDLWDKTVFVIRSDHGEEFAEHGELSHWNNLYEELVRVPFWVHIPGQKGKTVNNFTQNIDEAPTLLNALGLEPHPLMSGRNLLNSKSYEYQVDFAIAQKSFSQVFSVRDGNYKLISVNFNLGQTYYELYNLRDDPGEKNNIIEENQEIKEKLLFKYYNIINRQPRFKPSNKFFERLTDRQKNNLYENGYF